MGTNHRAIPHPVVATPTLHPIARAVAQSLRPVPGRTGLACAATLGLALAGPIPAEAATFTVTNTNDSGPGSLRQAVLDANANPGADEVVFSSVSGTIGLRLKTDEIRRVLSMAPGE